MGTYEYVVLSVKGLSSTVLFKALPKPYHASRPKTKQQRLADLGDFHVDRVLDLRPDIFLQGMERTFSISSS